MLLLENFNIIIDLGINVKLRKKILYTVIFSTIIFTFLKEINSFLELKRVAESDLNKKIEVTGELIKGIVSNPIYNLNYDVLNESVLLFFQDPDIVSIKLLESGGAINIAYENSDITEKNIIIQEIIINYRGVELGDVTVIYTKNNIIKKLQEAIRNIIISITLLIVVISLFLYFMLKKMIDPINELTSLSVEISNGNLNKSIDINSNDEIGILAKSFMVMKDSIKQQIHQIQIEIDQKDRAEKRLLELNINLEDKVKERTNELEVAFENIQSTQKKLIESEKMSSLGMLVSGVAHEINTPVGIAVTAASHLQEEVNTFRNNYHENKITRTNMESFLTVCNEIADIILSNMFKGRKLIKSFKNIAVDQTSEQKREINVKQYLEEILLSTHSKFKRTDIDINILCDDDIMLNSYPGALSQVITNLLLNSLYHGFENIQIGEIDILVSKVEDYIVINYSDTGCGIPEEYINKIFNPFFTTKRGKGGSGLGLSIVYNLVTSALGGEVDCHSQTGIGTDFIIKLPLELT